MFKAYNYDKTITLVEEPMIHLKRVKKFKTSFYRTHSEYGYVSFETLRNRYFDGLIKEETKHIKNKISEYDNPVFIYFADSHTKKETSDNNRYYYYLKSKVEVYEYMRYSFFNEIKAINNAIKSNEYDLSKLEGKTGIINKIIRYFENKKYQEALIQKDNHIKNYIDRYFSWFETKFVTLKLPKALLDELKKSTLIAMKFDMLKPILLLDNLIEKIALFLNKGKALEGNAAFSTLIDRSVEDFTQYVEKQIKIMNEYKNNSYIEEKVINKDMESTIEKIKKDVFTDADDTSTVN